MPAWLAGALAHPAPRLLLTVAGFAAIVFGLLANSLVGRTDPQPFGVPTAALAAFLGGAGVLRLLRSVPREHG